MPDGMIVEGGGPHLVLIHGVGLDLNMWHGVAAPLEPYFTVMRYNMIGHGQTPAAGGELTLDALCDQLAALADQADLPKFHLVGFSMGALVAQAFALSNPYRVNKLVLLSPVYDRSQRERAAVCDRLRDAERNGLEAIADAAIERWFTMELRRDLPQIADAIRGRLLANDPEGFLAAYRLFAGADALIAPHVGQIEHETLILTGERDVGSTPEMARRLAAAMPNATCEILEHLAHMTPIEGASVIASKIEAFLTDVSQEPG
jgi:pimeloyl-ACP methyl ester carboxylesterase